MLMRHRGGFALIEMIVVVALISLLTYIGYPYYQVFMRNAAYRSAARGVASAMQTARTQAVSMNREHRLEIDLDNDRFRLNRGDRARRSESWEKSSWESVSPLANLQAAQDPSDPSDCSEDEEILDLRFYPNGTTNRTLAVCVLNPADQHKFTTRLLFPTTGQVEVVRP